MRYARKINYVDAVQYNGENWEEIRKFVDWKPGCGIYPTHKFGPIQIETPSGPTNANPTDWVCRDSSGKYYPCIDEVFRATYYVDEEEIPLDVVEKMVPDDVKDMWKDVAKSR